MKERAKMTPDEVERKPHFVNLKMNNCTWIEAIFVPQVGPFVARGREIIGAWEKLPMPVIAALDGVRRTY